MANKFLGIGAGVEQVKKADSLSERAAKIKAMHEAHGQTVRRSLDQAHEIGKELIAAKELCITESKPWLEWLKSTKINKRSAQGYIRIAEKWTTLVGHTQFTALTGVAEALIIVGEREPGEEEEQEPQEDTSEQTNDKPADVDDHGRKKKKKRKPASPKEDLTDELGNPLPPACRDAYADPSLENLIEELQSLESMVEPDKILSRVVKLAGHYPFLLVGDVNEHAFEALRRLQLTRETLIAGVPYALCPKCKGEAAGCKVCRGSGLVPEWKHKEAVGE